MNASDAVLSAIFLWSLALLASGQIALAVRAVVIERREGMEPSYRRLAAVSLVGALVVALAATAGASTRPTPQLAREKTPAPAPAPTRPVEAKAPVEKLQTTPEIEALEQQVKDLKAQLDVATKKLESARAALAPPPKPEPEPEKPPKPVPVAEPTVEPIVDRTVDPKIDVGPEPPPGSPMPRLFAVLVLELAGLAALFTLGERETLWPWQWGRFRGPQAKAHDDSRHRLDALAGAAEQGQHARGLELAQKIRVELLDRRELIDLYYLRAFCGVALAAGAQVTEPREKLLAQAADDLTRCLELAPNLGEADYLLSMCRALQGGYEDAVRHVRASEEKLRGEDLPFAEHRSACLLLQARERIARADSAGANALLDEVTRLGVLTACVPTVMLNNRLQNIRESLQRRKLDDVRQGIASVRQMTGLSDEHRRVAEGTCSICELMTYYYAEQVQETLTRVRDFLDTWTPEGLPEVDDSQADELLCPPTQDLELPLPAEVFRALYFLQAVVHARLAAGARRKLTDRDIDGIRVPLLRALQFDLRNRDALAALGALYYWFVPSERTRALGWLETAAALGVRSAIVRRLLDIDRQMELERRDLLDQFLSTSALYLRDPEIEASVRQALVEELGRFQEFQPLMLDLGQAPPPVPRSPTLDSLRERGQHLATLLASVLARTDPEAERRLTEVHRSYVGHIAALERSATALQSLERQVMETVGKTLLC